MPLNSKEGQLSSTISFSLYGDKSRAQLQNLFQMRISNPNKIPKTQNISAWFQKVMQKVKIHVDSGPTLSTTNPDSWEYPIKPSFNIPKILSTFQTLPYIDYCEMLLKFPPTVIVVSGPPGCGKSFLIKKFVSAAKAKLIPWTCEEALFKSEFTSLCKFILRSSTLSLNSNSFQTQSKLVYYISSLPSVLSDISELQLHSTRQFHKSSKWSLMALNRFQLLMDKILQTTSSRLAAFRRTKRVSGSYFPIPSFPIIIELTDTFGEKIIHKLFTPEQQSSLFFSHVSIFKPTTARLREWTVKESAKDSRYPRTLTPLEATKIVRASNQSYSQTKAILDYVMMSTPNAAFDNTEIESDFLQDENNDIDVLDTDSQDPPVVKSRNHYDIYRDLLFDNSGKLFMPVLGNLSTDLSIGLPSLQLFLPLLGKVLHYKRLFYRKPTEDDKRSFRQLATSFKVNKGAIGVEPRKQYRHLSFLISYKLNEQSTLVNTPSVAHFDRILWPLLWKPETQIDSITSFVPRIYLSLLFENYISFFTTDPSRIYPLSTAEIDTIPLLHPSERAVATPPLFPRDLQLATSYLSEADTFLKYRETEHYASSVATRGVLISKTPNLSYLKQFSAKRDTQNQWFLQFNSEKQTLNKIERFLQVLPEDVLDINTMEEFQDRKAASLPKKNPSKKIRGVQGKIDSEIRKKANESFWNVHPWTKADTSGANTDPAV